jgi:uncharacterized protein YndB with AHSA1/START domain
MRITRAITLRRPREVVWESIADRERLGAWLDGAVEVDLREGCEGTFRAAEGGERGMEVVEVVPGERLAFHWWAEDEPETRVELTLDDAPDGTRLTVLESPVVVELPVARAVEPARMEPRGPVALAV